MRRTLVLATAALLLTASGLLAGCGGSDESSKPTTTAAADGGSDSGSDSGTSSDGTDTVDPDLQAFCELDARLYTEVFENYEPGMELTEDQIALLEEAKATAPAEISNEVAAIVDTLTGSASDSAASDPGVGEGGNKVDEFVAANCN